MLLLGTNQFASPAEEDRRTSEGRVNYDDKEDDDKDDNDVYQLITKQRKRMKS